MAREPEQEHRWKAGAREFQASPEGSKDSRSKTGNTQTRTETGAGIQE